MFRKHYALITPVDMDGQPVGSPTRIQMRRTGWKTWASAEPMDMAVTATPDSFLMEFQDDTRIIPARLET